MGSSLQRILKEKYPWIATTFVRGFGDISSRVGAIKGGAGDFLEKPLKRAAPSAAIDCAIERTRSLRARQPSIKRCERQVFALVTAGLLNKQIAADLGTALRTIKQHHNRVMVKMSADSIADCDHGKRLSVGPSESISLQPKGFAQYLSQTFRDHVATSRAPLVKRESDADARLFSDFSIGRKKPVSRHNNC